MQYHAIPLTFGLVLAGKPVILFLDNIDYDYLQCTREGQQITTNDRISTYPYPYQGKYVKLCPMFVVVAYTSDSRSDPPRTVEYLGKQHIDISYIMSYITYINMGTS